MVSSALLLDLTLNDLEGQNQDWTNFSPLSGICIEWPNSQPMVIDKVL